MKTSLLLIPVTFFSGIALGYLDIFSLPEKEQSVISSNMAAKRRAPDHPQINDAEGSKIPLPSVANISSLFPKYAGLSPLETKKELLRLSKHSREKKHPKTNRYISDAIRYLACRLGAQSQEEAKRLMEDNDNPLDSNIAEYLLQGWATQDFEGARTYLLEHQNYMTEPEYAFRQMVQTLVKTDPAKALQWFSSLKTGDRTVALGAIAKVLPMSHPEQIKPFLEILSPADMKKFDMEYHFSKSWAASDWDSFKAWTNTLSNHQKKTAFEYGICSLSEIDPAKATEEFNQYEGKDKYSIAKEIVSGMRYDNQGKTLDWIMENIKDTTMASRLAEDMICGNTDATPEMTRKILSLPEGEIRDSALAKMVGTRSWMAKSDLTYDATPGDTPFEETMDLASKIGNQAKRDNSIKECLKYWIEKSPAEARQWIVGQSQLSDQDKRKFLQDCDSPPKEISTRLRFTVEGN